VVLAAVAALAVPWLVPAVPRLLAGATPEPAAPAATVAVPPQTEAPTTAPGTTLRTLQGKRLAAAGPPTRVTVPRLGVVAPVVPIRAGSGVLTPPADPQLLGWWRDGSVPGAARGTAVLTGHTVHTGGGALDHLGSLRDGDRVTVRTERGAIDYAVLSVRDLRTAQLARQREQVFRTDGPGRLVLVTCTDWNGVEYLSNAVVTAVPVFVH
jgi:LPXTG-site transpeptidase (sortase) family protein